jgi:formyltetrahydrofolate-dependent phosphoribosylglycinamide formyltransferase
MKSRIAVLASGSGTNLQAILDHFAWLGERGSADVVLVASDRPTAGALDRARRHNVAATTIGTPRSDGPTVGELLEAHGIDVIALAGYLRLVPEEVVREYRGRIVNVHPALLPAFGGPGMYGHRVHQAVLDAGVSLSGVTVHFVDEQYDRGHIIAQWPVPVIMGDDAASLAARVLRVEHVLYPRVLDAIAAGRITLSSHGGFAHNADAERVAFLLTSRDDSCLAETIDRALAR